MAGNRIKGITIEIEGNTTKLSESLRSVDKSLKDTQTQLKDVNKLLKLDPKNTELLRQKQQLLSTAVKDTEEKLKQEKEALKQLEAVKNPTEETRKQQELLKRDIEDTSISLKNYQNQLNQLNPTLQTVAATSQQVADKTRGISLAAGAAAGGILANAFAAAKTADDFNTLARNTGFSVEELQKMKYASDFVDVSFDSMTGSVTKLTKSMSSGSDAFEKLGVSIRDDVTGEMRDVTDVFYDSLTALSQVENETERDALAMDLFGKSAMDLSGIIDDGGAALQEYGQQAEDAGLILSGDTMQAANQLNDQVDQLKATTTAALLEAGAQLATVLAPAIEDIVNKVTELITWFGSLDGSTQAIIVTILGLVAAISPLASIISAIATLIPVVTAAFTVLMGPVGAVIAIIAALVAAGVALYQNWDTVKAKASELWTNITTTFDKIKETVLGAVEKIKGAFNFSWSLPPLKIPHFKVSGGEPPWGLMGKGTLPTISIDWYKKAYKNAIMFNTPTVLATGSGLKGFGDGNGSEMVVGTDYLVNAIRENSGAGELARIESLLEKIAQNPVMLQGDARQMFKVMRRQNANFRTSTGKSGFDY